MKNRNFRLISLLLSMIMIIGVFASCQGPVEQVTTDAPSKETTEAPSEITTEIPTEKDTEESTEDTTDVVEIETVEPSRHIDIVENANNLANGVQSFFLDGMKNSIGVSNQNMTLEYPLSGDANQLISKLYNTQGKSYIEDTMDVFVKMTDGTTLYASKTSKTVAMNVFRLGYYYYETRIEGQDFANGLAVLDSKELALGSDGSWDISSPVVANGNLSFTVKKIDDPWFVIANSSFNAEDYNYLRITLKAEVSSGDRTATIYYNTGDANKFPYSRVTFNIIADGEFHTYDICLSDGDNYAGDIQYLRFDVNNASPKDKFTISDITLIDGVGVGVPELSMARIFHAYSDKLHQEIQLATTAQVDNIAEIGFITEIAADTVEKIVVKDKNGTHDTLDGVDWASAEGVGFDIKDAGIFGYIMPVSELAGSLEVTLDNGVYTIIQSRVPENNRILPGEGYYKDMVGKVGNGNDFFMGQRLYTDENHTFDAFIDQVYIERHPLGGKNIKVSAAYSDMGRLVGYDPIRGCYEFYMSGSDFNSSYYNFPNRHYKLNFSIMSDKYERNVYILAATASGALESAALLDNNLMMLPIPIEVGKNFGSDDDYNIYDLFDLAYGEAIFPLSLTPNVLHEFTVVHLYQNWGNFPLKQLSFIEFTAPYYHMSCGVTESNCLVPLGWTTNWDVPNMLPDHRAMSAPLWVHQPQHVSGGNHSFLEYKSEDDKIQGATIQHQHIDAYGPTYFEITMNHISDNGKFTASYTNIEMPQTDENRGYYTLEYKFLEDMTFKDFRKTFSFYSVGDRVADENYTKFSYLNTDNLPVVEPTMNTESNEIYVLGDEAPYFAYYDIGDYIGADGLGYCNVSCIIKDYEVIIGGEKQDVSMAIRKNGANIALTLDLEKVTFKAGDSIVINAILVPWGSQETDYDTYEDQNVLDVRENSVLNPIVAIPGTDTVAIESAFVPKVKTTNGKSAEFTLSGGAVSEYPEILQPGAQYNMAVRVYGFDKLSVPKVYEKVNGEWVEYVLNSANNLDKYGYGAWYDGYNVYYDEDGTYSYSFVVDMTAAQDRIFKVELDETFEKWPMIITEEPVFDPIEFYHDPLELKTSSGGVAPRFTDILLMEEGGTPFTRYLAAKPQADGGRGRDAYFCLFTNGDKATGKYLVMKYKSNAEKNVVQFFSSTTVVSERGEATGNGDFFSLTSELYITDDQWHVIVLDLDALLKAYSANDAGEYVPKFLRMDVFNFDIGDVSTDEYVDIAYVGIGSDLEEIVKLATEVNEVLVYDGNLMAYDPATGAPKQ